MTHKDWDDDAIGMSNSDLRKRLAAMAVLREWPTFYKAFQGFGTFAIYHILKAESDRRSDNPLVEFRVIVANIGTVYSGPDAIEAREQYGAYVRLSQGDHGRATGEAVTLMCDDVIVAEHAGTVSE